MRAEHRQHLEQARMEKIAPAMERRLKARLHARELGAVFLHEPVETRRVARCDGGDLPLHFRDVRRGVDLPAAAGDDAVLRIEPLHFHLRPERGAGGGEDFLQHARIKEKGRAEVELEAIGLDGRRAPADGREALEDFHFHARSREEDGRGESAGPCADDDDVFAHGVVRRVKVGSKFRLHSAGAGHAPAARGLEGDECGACRECDPCPLRMLPCEGCAHAHREGSDATDDAAFGVDIGAEE